jgi:hypothetical protein
MRRAWLLALSLSSCSFLLVDGPPARHRELPDFSCTEGIFWPVVDGVISAGSLAGALSAQAAGEGAGRSGGLAGGLVTAALFGASAIWGFLDVGECREAIEEREARRAQPIGPVPGPWPSSPPRPPPPGELPPGWKR